MNRTFNISMWFITIATPFFLLMTIIRLLITPILPEIEYRTPGFPDDSYGFTFEERLKYANIAIDYLVSNEDISFLAKLKLPNNAPLYNQRELTHFVDVKKVIRSMILVWDVILAILLLLTIWAWRSRRFRDFGIAIWRGGITTVGLIIMLLVGVFAGFEQLFTGFHALFFTGDSWIFLYSDTLIRLFPIPFWQNVFIGAGILTIIGAVLCIIAGRKLYLTPQAHT